MTLRDDVIAEADPKVRARLKAEFLRNLWSSEWVEGFSVTRRVNNQNWEIRFDERPKLIRDRLGQIVGIDAMVRVFRGNNEIRIDPHRICINPPIMVPDGTTSPVVVNGVTRQVANLELNPREAYLRWLVDSIRDNPNQDGWRTRGTVTTIFTDTSDGQIGSTGSGGTSAANYAAAIAGANLIANTTGAGFGITIGQSVFGTNRTIRVGYFQFDTSSIPDADSVSAVAFSPYVDFNSANFTMQARTFDWGTGLTTADWSSNVSALTLLGTFDLTAGGTGYKAFTENGTNFQSAINKTGQTRFLVCSNRHASATEPSVNEESTVTGADNAGTTQDAKLVITHAAGNSITFAATLKAITAAFVANQSQVTSIAATFKKVTAAFVATQTQQTQIAATFKPVSAAFSATQSQVTSIAATLKPITANFNALIGVEPAATFAATFKPVSASFVAQHPYVTTFAATLPKVSGQLTVEQTQVASFASTFPRVSAAFVAAQPFSVSVSATFKPVTGSFLAAQVYVTMFAATLPKIGFSANAIVIVPISTSFAATFKPVTANFQAQQAIISLIHLLASFEPTIEMQGSTATIIEKLASYEPVISLKGSH